MRYVAGRPRRSSSVRCFGMVRHASLRGDTPYWLAMARYDTPGVRRYASVCVGSGCPVWLVMVRFAGVRECAASRHLLWSVEEPGLIWRVFSRGPGRRIPDRLTMSRYVAPPARAIPGVRVIFPEYRAASGPCGGLIGAGSGSVRAPGVPVPVTVCVPVRVMVGVPRALSHCPAVKYGALL